MPGQIERIRESVPRSVIFLRETWAEFRKVHFPTRKETYAGTSVVLVIVALIGVYLGLVDFVLSQLMRLILH